jgi:CDP-diacylglycerol---glycerol-3-phosphate 3-phosphatidyltransferase
MTGAGRLSSGSVFREKRLNRELDRRTWVDYEGSLWPQHLPTLPKTKEDPFVMDLRHTALARGYYRLLETALLPWLRRRRIAADQMTWIGVLIAVTVPPGFALNPLVGLLLMLLSGSADALDGRLARENHQPSPWGAFLDSSLDRLSDGCYLLGFWLLFWQADRALTGTLLLWPALVTTLLISYVKARAEGLGGDCPVGWMERAARIIYLCGWALSLGLLPAMRETLLVGGAVIYLGLTVTTVFQRLRYVYLKGLG